MIEYDSIDIDLLVKHEGDYIQFGGHGIIDGLDRPSFKHISLKICGRRWELNSKSGEIEITGVYLKKYRCKNHRILPATKFNQRCRVFTPEEYKKMHPYPWSQS